MVIKDAVNMNCIYVLHVNVVIVVSFLNADTFRGHFLLGYLEVLSFHLFFWLLLYVSDYMKVN